jgi:hypothetical protein
MFEVQGNLRRYKLHVNSYLRANKTESQNFDVSDSIKMYEVQRGIFDMDNHFQRVYTLFG